MLMTLLKPISSFNKINTNNNLIMFRLELLLILLKPISGFIKISMNNKLYKIYNALQKYSFYSLENVI